MYEKILKLKNEKKWLFYILIIPFLFLFLLEMYNKYVINSSKKIVKEAEENDDSLEKEQIKAEQGAKYHQEKAEEIEKEIENTKINKDWHLK